jgi:hypothetical protein
MKHTIKTLAAAAALALLSASTFAGDIKITNSSDWQLDHLFMSTVDEEEWGPDQLGDEVIGTGESFNLKGVPCATYDVKLVDEDGDECEVRQVDVCGSGGWNIGNDDLLDCQAKTE